MRPTARSIGAIAKRTGCNIETIRYYERIGLIEPPRRSPGGYRLYSDEDARRLIFVRRGRALGFTLDQIRSLLALASGEPRSCTKARALAGKHLRDIEAKIADLNAIRDVIGELVARCADGDRPSCPLIDSLAAPEALAPRAGQ